MVHKKYVSFILPRHPWEISCKETVQILTKIFGDRCSLFNTCWQCLNLTRKENADYTTFASIFNRECEKFRLSEITPDMFKCLIFVQDLTALTDAEIRSRLLTKLEQDQKITLQNLADVCQHILNLRADMVKIEDQDISHIHAVWNKPKGRKKETSFKSNPCFGCGELHLFKNCPFKNKV